MALNFKNYERAERVSLGTIANLVGPGGTIKPITMSNWLNAEIRVQLVLTQKNGASDVVTCSPEVSKRLRSKEIKISQLPSFEVEEQLNAQGEIINMIKMPSAGSTMPDYEITGKEEAYAPVATFNVEELIAF